MIPKQTNRPMVQNKGQDIDPYVYDLLIYSQWVKDSFQQKVLYQSKIKSKLRTMTPPSHHIKNSRWTSDIKVKGNRIKLSDNNMKNILMTQKQAKIS